jgi:plasmid stabilization system protein ParE
MYTIEWTQTALTDLEIILAYYAQKVSPELAKKIFLKIQSQVKVLGQFPKSARM